MGAYTSDGSVSVAFGRGNGVVATAVARQVTLYGVVL